MDVTPANPIDPLLASLGEVVFDVTTLAKFPPASRKVPTASQREQASWAADLISARSRSRAEVSLAFPTLAVRILRIMQEPEPELRTLVAAIHEDPVVAAQVLRVANSAFYTRGIEVRTLHEAAVRIGLRSIANVAVAAATKAVLDDREFQYRRPFEPEWKALWVAALETATAARHLAAWLNRGDREEAFLAGLMHDLGKVVALRAAGELVHDGDLSPEISPVVLALALELSHGSLGRELAISWGLPGYVTWVCDRAHDEAPEPGKANEVLHLVRISSALQVLRANPLHRETAARELFTSARALGLAAGPLEAAAGELAERMASLQN